MTLSPSVIASIAKHLLATEVGSPQVTRDASASPHYDKMEFFNTLLGAQLTGNHRIVKYMYALARCFSRMIQAYLAGTFALHHMALRSKT